MKKHNLFTILFPSVIMLLMAMILFTDINSIDLKGLFIISIVALFPLLFLIQGITCVLSNTNFIISLLISIATYKLIMIIFMNDLVYEYILYYVVSFAIGYLISKFIRKINLSKEYKI